MIQKPNIESTNKLDKELNEFIINIVKVALIKEGLSKKDALKINLEDAKIYLNKNQ